VPNRISQKRLPINWYHLTNGSSIKREIVTAERLRKRHDGSRDAAFVRRAALLLKA
jgi:hypothetical protein